MPIAHEGNYFADGQTIARLQDEEQGRLPLLQRRGG